MDMVRGIVGLNGFALPQGLFDRLGPLTSTFHSLGVVAVSWNAHDFESTAFWIVVLMFVALACPNTMQILWRYEPALGVKAQTTKSLIGRIGEWDASLPWTMAMSAIAALAVISMGGPSEFLYWQF